RPRVLGRARLCPSGERGREALVEAHDGDVDRVAQRLDEPLRLARLLAVLAAQRQRQPDDDSLRLLGPDELEQPSEPGFGRGPLDHADRSRERAGRVRDGHAGPRGTVVEREHLHARAERIWRSAAARASSSLFGSRPPASASVGRPPPPPPMIGATSRTTCAASRPFSAREESRLTTRNARPSTAEPSRTASACSRCISWSERSRSAPRRTAFVSATTTPPSLRRTTTS